MISSDFKVKSRAALALLAGGFALFWSGDAPVPSGSLSARRRPGSDGRQHP